MRHHFQNEDWTRCGGRDVAACAPGRIKRRGNVHESLVLDVLHQRFEEVTEESNELKDLFSGSFTSCIDWWRPSESVDIAPARKALAFAPSVSLMTELHCQLYKTSLRTKTAIVRHGKPHVPPYDPSEPRNPIERYRTRLGDKRTGNHTMALTIPTSRLNATMCKSVAQFSKDSVRFDSYLLCTFRRADCGCPRADTLRSAPCDCGGNCWDALGCAFNMHGAPAFGCKDRNHLTADTVEHNSHSGTCFCNTRTSVVQSMNRTCGDSTVSVQFEIRALVSATQLVRRRFNQ